MALCDQQDLSSPFARRTMCSSGTLGWERSLSYLARASVFQSAVKGPSIHIVLISNAGSESYSKITNSEREQEYGFLISSLGDFKSHFPRLSGFHLA